MCVDLLYKYRNITNDDRQGAETGYTRNLILNGDLYFPKFSELGDPNEAIFDYSGDVDIAILDNQKMDYPDYEFIELLPDGRNRIKVDGRAGALHVRKQIDEMYGILCLTKENKNPLMFDYYAGGHTGICLGIEWKRLGIVYRGTNQHQQPRPIVYCRKPPAIDATNANDFDNVFFRKWIEYKHEQEYRLTYCHGLFTNKQNVLNSIKEIIFGVATSDDDKALVKNWVKSAKLDVNLYDAHLKPKSYEILLQKHVG